MAVIIAEDRDFGVLGKKRSIMVAWLRSEKAAAGVFTPEGEVLLPNLLACATFFVQDGALPKLAKMVSDRDVINEFLDVLPEYYERFGSLYGYGKKKSRMTKMLKLVQVYIKNNSEKFDALMGKLAPFAVPIDEVAAEEEPPEPDTVKTTEAEPVPIDTIHIQEAIEGEIRKAAALPEKTKVPVVPVDNLRSSCTADEAKSVVELMTGGVSLLTACSMVGVKQQAAMAQIIYSKTLTDAYRDAIYIQTRTTTDILAMNLASAVSNLLQERQVVHREMSRVPVQYFDDSGKQQIKMVVVKDKVVQQTKPPTEATVRNALAIYESLLKKQADYENYRIAQLRASLEGKTNDELKQITDAG